MGAVNTTYTFTATDVITSSKMNDIIDQTTMTGSAILGSTLQVTTSGQLAVNAQGITSNELAENAVKTIAIENGAVTQAKTSNFLVPTGAVMPFAMNSVPTGWLEANGQEVGRTAYPALFSAIGVTYGALNSTTFTIPDLRAYFIRGFGTNTDGAFSGNFGVKQADEFKSHNHDMWVHPGTASGGNTNPARGNDLGIGNLLTGSRGGTETRPKNIALLYCIKF